MGLNFIFGFAGQLHMGVAAFLGIGSYAFSLAAVKYGWNWWAAAILSIIVVGIFSLFLGFPTLRLKRYYLAIMTIGFQEITRSVLMNWSSFTGGFWDQNIRARPSGLQFTDNRSSIIASSVDTPVPPCYHIRQSGF